MIEKLPEDVLMILRYYVSLNNLFDCNKELHKLKKKFLMIKLDIENTVKFFKKNEFRDYIYSLIENPKKQLILNIKQDCYDIFRKKEMSLDFIFNENDDFKSEYLNILNNVYKYKFTYLSLNIDISTNFHITRDVFNKKYLNFIDLDVFLYIEDLLINNVKYDFEHILKNKKIKIKRLSQTLDTLCFDDYKQYLLYEKLKEYSKKYSIILESIENRELIRKISKFDQNTLWSFRMLPIPPLPPLDIPEPPEIATWRKLENSKNENELPILTNEYIQQMNLEYKTKNKNKTKNKTKNKNKNKNKNKKYSK